MKGNCSSEFLAPPHEESLEQQLEDIMVDAGTACSTAGPSASPVKALLSVPAFATADVEVVFFDMERRTMKALMPPRVDDKGDYVAMKRITFRGADGEEDLGGSDSDDKSTVDYSAVSVASKTTRGARPRGNVAWPPEHWIDILVLEYSLDELPDDRVFKQATKCVTRNKAKKKHEEAAEQLDRHLRLVCHCTNFNIDKCLAFDFEDLKSSIVALQRAM